MWADDAGNGHKYTPKDERMAETTSPGHYRNDDDENFGAEQVTTETPLFAEILQVDGNITADGIIRGRAACSKFFVETYDMNYFLVSHHFFWISIMLH